ncbi:MAG: glycosyltransferase family 39 protein [Patescibacteria group bacterium]|mgnify:CR=1 FL=1
MRKFELILLIVFFILGFVFRLYRFDSPIADWHSWRQADTSSVSRNFVENGFDLLHPKFDDLSNVPSGLDNPEGYRFVEFPIYNFLQGFLFKSLGILTLEEWGRLVSIGASMLSAVFLFLIVKRRFGASAAFISFVFFLFLPFNIYFSRTILPDPSMVTAILGGIYFFGQWIDLVDTNNKKKWLYFILSLVFTSVSFLIKPYALFFTLPIIYMSFEKFGFSVLKKWQLYIFAVLSVIPLALWRMWMTNFPAGIPASNWLFNEGNIRFKGAYFYWLFGERISRLILGYFGLPLLILGFLRLNLKKELLFLLSFVLSSLIYMVVIARGNVQHDYYQILIIPSLCMLLGVGGVFLTKPLGQVNKYVFYSVFLVCTILSIMLSWYYVRDYYNINNPSIISAGAAVDRITPKDAKIIANYNGDTSFLYQTKRKGWASFQKSLPEMVQMGAAYLVLVNPTKEDLGIGTEYKIVAVTKEYVIFNLNEKP